MKAIDMIEWAALTNTEIEALDRDKLVILPLGLIEAHGPHLATSVDVDTATYFARRLAENTGSILLPTVQYGFADEMRAYPGTLGVSLKTMAHIISDIAALLCEHGFRRQIWLSGHGANTTPAEVALHRIWARFPDIQAVYWNYWSAAGVDGISHADKKETEIAAAVGTPYYPDRARDWKIDKPWYRIRSRRDVHSDSGGINGYPTHADIKEGKALCEHIVTQLTKRVGNFDHSTAQG